MAAQRPGLDSLSDRRLDRITQRGFAVMGIGIRRQWSMFAGATAFSVLFGAMTVADAWVLGWATDEVIVPSVTEGRIFTGALVAGVVLFLTVSILRMIGVIGRRLLGGIVFYRLMRQDRRAVTRQYLDLPLSWHRNHPAGQLLSNANSDVEAAWSVFNPLPMAIGVLAMLIAAVVSMFIADPVLAAVGLVVFPLLFVLNIVYQRWQGPRVAHAQSLRGAVSTVAHESFDGALVIKSLGREADETQRFAATSAKLRDANIGVGRIRAIFDPILEALPNVGVLLVIVVGVSRVNSGAIAPGDVVQVAFLFTVVAMPLRAIGWVLGELPRSVVGWNRVQSVLNVHDTMTYGSEGLAGSGPVRLEVRDVSFAHESDVPAILSDISFDVEPGQVAAIVGSTGSGKSTLVSIITRLVDPTIGSVLIDDIDVRELTHDDLAATIALVPQTTFLFDDTVRSNITLGADIDDDEVWSVLKDVQADRFVRGLPNGLDTELGERGTSLSGGQRQRLALARALVRQPRLLVMDDATSALDPSVEQRILRALAARSEAGTGPTVLVIAYRKATIAMAHEVVHIDQGRVIGRGTHEELRARSARYRNLVDAYDQAREDLDHE